jgi:lysophospholipase L1-like esterase
MREGLKSFAKRLCVCITAFVVLLLAGEVAASYKIAHSSNVPAQEQGPRSIYASETWTSQYRREFAASDRVQYKPYVLWRRAPFSGTTINLDSDGIRKTYYTSCDPNAYTIWMFGDSALWGAGSPDWETIPSFLAHDYGAAGRKLCIKNFGEKAWVSTQEIIQLILALKQTPSTPNLIIFYDGVSDSFVPYMSTVSDSHMNFEDIKRLFEQGSTAEQSGFSYLKQTNTYRVLEMLRDRFTSTAVPPSAESHSGLANVEMAQRTLLNYQKNMDVVETLAHHFGIQCLFVWQPVLLTGSKPLSSEEKPMVQRVETQLRPGSTALLRATYELVKGIQRPDFLYLGDVFAGSDKTMFVDYSHPGPDGNRVIAQKIFDFASKRGLDESSPHVASAR